MTVTSTTLGPNTVNINISGEYNVGNIINAIDNVLTTHSWAQFDLITPTNASYAYQRIYRSTNVDGTFKYMQLFFYPWKHKIFIDFFESWNATTHVGTNQCYMGPMDIGASIDYGQTACNILIMANSHWCVMMSSFTLSYSSMTADAQFGPWVGCFEVTRDALEDTIANGIPCWFATTSLKLANGGTTGNNGTILESGYNGTAQFAVSFPRTSLGTGYTASMHSGSVTPYFSSGCPNNNASIGAILGNVLGTASAFFNNGGNYAWDFTKKIASLFRVNVGAELHGTVIGAKLMSNQFSTQAKVTMPLDANYIYSSVGTPTDHVVLPLQVQTYRQLTINNLHQYNTISAVGFSNSSMTYFKNIFLAPNGYYYVCTGASIYKINPISVQTLVISGLPGNLIDSCFDGRYIYTVSNSANGSVYTIDTQNFDSVITNTTVGANLTPYSICCDDVNIWVGCRNSVGPAINVVQITKSSPTAVAFTTACANSASVSYPLTVIPDNDGNCFTIGSQNIWTSNNTNVQNYSWKIAPGGTTTSLSSGVWSQMCGQMLVGPRKILTFGASTYSNFNLMLVSSQTLSTDTLTQSTSICMQTSGSNYFTNTVGGNNTTTGNLQTMALNHPIKLSTYGSTVLLNQSGGTYGTAMYVNTAVNSNLVFNTQTYLNDQTVQSWQGFGEMKYNQWFGLSGNGGGSLVAVYNIFRADDINSYASGRMILPY